MDEPELSELAKLAEMVGPLHVQCSVRIRTRHPFLPLVGFKPCPHPAVVIGRVLDADLDEQADPFCAECQADYEAGEVLDRLGRPPLKVVWEDL